MDLPLNCVVDGLVRELGLTSDEATTAAFDALAGVEPKACEFRCALPAGWCARL